MTLRFSSSRSVLECGTPVPLSNEKRKAGSVLIIVLWVSFGLVTLALYFANSMSFEFRAADNRAATIQAEQGIAGAARYMSNIIVATQTQQRGTLPDATLYDFEAVPIGDATFWCIGRWDQQQQRSTDIPYFGLVDESSKLNINVATRQMLEALPRMTPELAAAIIDWRDADDDVTEGGAESQTYLRLNPPYRCKNANFESLEELRLVAGAQLDILYGEDTNLNGALDPNENDGDTSLPSDNRDSRLDYGILEYLTVYSRQPTTGTNVNERQAVAALLQQKFDGNRANQILAALGNGGSGNVLQFYVRSGMTREEFAQIEGDLVGTNTVGLVNVNTASEAVLACIPGIGTEKASSLVAYRRSNGGNLNTVAWLKEVLDENAIALAGPWVTGRSYQFCADIAAVGHHGRGYARAKFIFDVTEGAAKVLYREDLAHLGWALGPDARKTLLLAKELR
jgi:type II secretory pathway component PulK